MNPDSPSTAHTERPTPPTGSAFVGFKTMTAWGLGLTLRPGALLLSVLIAVALGGLSRFLVTEGGAVKATDRLAENLWLALDFEILWFLVPIAVLLLVGPAFSREVRNRTLVYHLVRPVSRSAIFASRFISGWLPAALIVWLLLASTSFLAPVALPVAFYLQLIAVALVAAFALGAIYYALSVVFQHGLIAGLLYTFLVEVLLASLPGNIQRMSVRFHIRSLYHGLTDENFAPHSHEIHKVVRKGLRPESLGSESDGNLSLFEQVPFSTPLEAFLTLCVIGAVLLTLGSWVVARRDFALKD